MDTRAPWLVLGIVLGGTLLVSPLLADDHPASWASDERRLSFHQTPDGFRFESVRDSEFGRDDIQGTYSITNRRYTLTYLDNTAPNMTPLRMSVDFEALVEYRDLDGDNSFGLGDRIVQRIRVGDLPQPKATVELVGDGGRRATYEYILPMVGEDDEQASMTLAYSMFPRPQSIDGEMVPPTRAHIELRVERFPFENLTSRLALETRVLGNAPIRENADGFFIAGSERRIVYTWPGESWVDGDERPVHVTLLGSGGQTTGAGASPAVVLHSYERGEDLSYQPVVGVEREDPERQNALVEFFTRGDWRLYGIGMLMAFALIGATVWRRMGPS